MPPPDLTTTRFETLKTIKRDHKSIKHDHNTPEKPVLKELPRDTSNHKEGILDTPQRCVEPIPNRVKAKRKRKVSKISEISSINAIRDRRSQWLGMGFTFVKPESKFLESSKLPLDSLPTETSSLNPGGVNKLFRNHEPARPVKPDRWLESGK